MFGPSDPLLAATRDSVRPPGVASDHDPAPCRAPFAADCFKAVDCGASISRIIPHPHAPYALFTTLADEIGVLGPRHESKDSMLLDADFGELGKEATLTDARLDFRHVTHLSSSTASSRPQTASTALSVQDVPDNTAHPPLVGVTSASVLYAASMITASRATPSFTSISAIGGSAEPAASAMGISGASSRARAAHGSGAGAGVLQSSAWANASVAAAAARMAAQVLAPSRPGIIPIAPKFSKRDS